MPALTFDTCCGCIDLRTGCLIIGYMQLAAEILVGVMAVFILVGGSLGFVTVGLDSVGLDSYSGVTISGQDQGGVGVYELVIAIILLLVYAIHMGFNIAMLVGVHKNKRGHVKAYLIYSAVFLALNFIIVFVNLSQTVDEVSVISNLLALALTAYFFLVVRSYYYKMDDVTKGAIHNTA